MTRRLGPGPARDRLASRLSTVSLETGGEGRPNIIPPSTTATETVGRTAALRSAPGRTAALLWTLILGALALGLSPAMIDGDGLTHSERAISQGFLEGMEPKHPLAAMALRAIYLPLSIAGGGHLTLRAFTAFSAACGAMTFALLRWRIFPRFIKSPAVSLLCALGVFLSYGVLSRSSTVEVYAPALFLDVLVVAYCLRSPFTRRHQAVLAGLLLVLAVGFHVGNVLMIPGLIALVAGRVPRDRRVDVLASCAAGFVLGMGLIGGLLWLGPGRAEWPPDWSLILPRRDPEPPLGLGGRLGRAVYGFARTVAYLPYVRDLRASRALPYAILVGGAALWCLHLARRNLADRSGGIGRVLLGLAVLGTPFVVMGVAYYPSDPERWLFLMPVLWLLVGLAWDRPEASGPRRALSTDGPILLGVMVFGVGLYNAAAVLPEARSNRHLAGLRTLAEISEPDDLILSPGGVLNRMNAFYLDHPVRGEEVTVMALVKAHGADHRGLQADLAGRIDDALRGGRRVLVFNFIGERHRKQEGYPWNYVGHDYGPDTFLSVLDRFEQGVIAPSSPDREGIVRLRPGRDRTASEPGRSGGPRRR
jgi:hypothetical protein